MVEIISLDKPTDNGYYIATKKKSSIKQIVKVHFIKSDQDIFIYIYEFGTSWSDFKIDEYIWHSKILLEEGQKYERNF